MTKRPWIYSIVFLALMFILGGTSYIVSASSPDAERNSSIAIVNTGNCTSNAGVVSRPDDGLAQLPQNLLGVSYSALLLSGEAKPVHLDLKADPNAKFQPRRGSPQSNVVWGPEYNASGLSASSEPDGNLHPSNAANILVSGNISLDTTTDGGAHWHSLYPPWGVDTVDDVAAFAPKSPNQDTAIAAGLINCTPTCQLAAGLSTDRGNTWQSFSPTNFNSVGYFNDRPDLWTDNDPASLFYGRMYLTESLADAHRSQSYNTLVTKYSTDDGQSWSPFFEHDTTNTFFTDGDKVGLLQKNKHEEES